MAKTVDTATGDTGIPAGDDCDAEEYKGASSMATQAPGGNGASPEAEGKPETEQLVEAKKEAVKKASMGEMISLASGAELGMLAFGVVAALANGMLQPIIILLWGDMIDGLASPGSQTTMTDQQMADMQAQMDASMDKMMDDITQKCFEICMMGVAAIVVGAMQGFCFKKFAELMQQKMLKQYYEVLLHKDISWFDAQDPAGLPQQTTADAQAFGEAWGDKLGTAIMGLSTFLGGYIFAYVRGWPIALVMTGTLPLIAFGSVVMGAAMQDVALETQSWYAKASSVAEETFFAIRTVVAFGGEHREIEKYSSAVANARWGGVKNQAKIGAGMGYTMAICFLTYGLAFYVGMRFRYDKVENPGTGEPWKPGEILGVFFCVLMGSFMLGTMEPGAKAFDNARICVARFFVARDTPDVIQSRGTDARKPITSIEQLELRDAEFAYPASSAVQVLRGLSLRIEKGQKVALVGESGSGKSTVMSLLERFYDVQAGQVLVNGQNIKDFSISELRKCIGYVGQEPVLFATSIRENILLGTAGADNQMLQKVLVDAQVGFVNDLPEKLDTYVGSGGLQMSGGQKQRIAIARALIKQASVLFFDEATSALDNVSEQMIQETIDSLSTKAQSLTIVTIAHRLSTVRDADVIHVLSKGKLVESGTHPELIAKAGLYHALVASQDAALNDAQEQASPESQQAAEEAAFNKMSSVDVSGLKKQVSSNSKEDSKDRDARNMVNKSHDGGTGVELDAEEQERQKLIAKQYKVPMVRLLGFCKREWCFFIPGILGALYDGSSQPLTGWLLVEAMYAFQLDDEAMKKKLEEVSLHFLILSVGELIAVTMSYSCFGMLGESLTMRMRTALFSKVFEQEMGFHDDPENSPGALTGALQIYAFRVSNLCKAIGQKANAMMALVVGLTIGFVACWQVALVLLGAVPVLIGANILQMVVLLGGSGNETEKMKRAQQLVSESVQNVRTVHACGSERILIGMHAKVIASSSTPVAKHIIAGMAFGLSGGVMFFIMGVSFYVMGLFLKDGTGDFRELMIAFMSVFFAAMGAGQAASMMGDASKATVAAHDALKLLDRQSQINGMFSLGVQPSGNIQCGCIEFQAVHFHYPFRPDVKVLKGVTFSVQAGQTIGVVGPSGGGKSTIMALLQRYYDPMEGNILIGTDRQKLREVDIRWWRQQLGFVGQEPILFNTTVRANVLYGLQDWTSVSDEHIETCRTMSHLDFLELEGGKGWNTEVGPKGSHLSGGQKQRVAICRALVRNPSVLLLDEATSALDTQSEAVVQEALEAARKGRTSFAIAHRLSTISDSDAIMVVAEGVILEKGTHQELMELGGVYEKLQQSSGDRRSSTVKPQ